MLPNSGDPDQTLRFAASDLGLHCLPMPFYGTISRSGLIWLRQSKTNRTARLSWLSIEHTAKLLMGGLAEASKGANYSQEISSISLLLLFRLLLLLLLSSDAFDVIKSCQVLIPCNHN